MIPNNVSIFILVFLTALPINLMAAPEVIYDSGQTQSLTRYQVRVNTPPTVPDFTLKPPEIKFPVKTPELTPGKVTTRRIHHPYLDRPFFIIGADRRSLGWLQAHAPQLQKHQATGIVVNIDSRQQLNKIRQLAANLEINPLPASKLAKQLALQHYPVFISSSRIEQ